jgi:hypothetical protein
LGSAGAWLAWGFAAAAGFFPLGVASVAGLATAGTSATATAASASIVEHRRKYERALRRQT